ncbi:hypothetical protein RJT34_16457 [Clitoria ternatea]|uniref:Ubiquinol oxidase n=1 Tax=Clitoria ternatea TaxID=43366 RepID=A0AAN9J7F8_CLITE
MISKDFVRKILDTLYHDRHYARFFVLETIARVPYFAFMSVLHMYESFRWWRRADYLKVHFAESWNKMHHLLIMENQWSQWAITYVITSKGRFYWFSMKTLVDSRPHIRGRFSRNDEIDKNGTVQWNQIGGGEEEDEEHENWVSILDSLVAASLAQESQDGSSFGLIY